MRFSHLLSVLFIFIANLTPAAWAAPCCAGSSALPSLMTGDERAKLGLSASEGHIVGDAPEKGIPVFRADANSEVTQTLQLNGAYLLSDRWQAGIGLPFVDHSLKSKAGDLTHSDIGDTQLSATYEAIPEWGYNPYIPKGYVFTQLTLPTGQSIYDSSRATDATGKGFTTWGLGGYFLKQWGSWDASLIPEIHYSFSRSFSETQTKVFGFSGASTQFGGGYNWNTLRLGGFFQPNFTQGKKIEIDGTTSVTANQWVWNAGVSLSYLFDQTSMSLTYSDQTLLGPAVNTSLSRAVALNIDYRWWR